MERYRRGYDITFLNEHPNFIGFMEHPADNGMEAQSIRIDPPFRENLLALMEQHSKIAPYTCHLVNGFVDNEPSRYMVFRYGLKGA